MNETQSTDTVPTVTPNPNAGRRPTLGELAALDEEALMFPLGRVLPNVGGQIGVSAFQSSI